MIFWWPPGSGKTSLAYILSEMLVNVEFFHLSWVLSRKEDVVKILRVARTNFSLGKQTIIFLDEIHRWNKAQQDTLLPFVEKGIVTLIGATTENPSFTINNALISRTRVYTFEKITVEQCVDFLRKNRTKIQERYPEIDFSTSEESPKKKKKKADTWEESAPADSPTSEKTDPFTLIAHLGNGDLRNTLNILETACMLQWTGVLSRENILQAGEQTLLYDRDGEEHHNLISAVHKSLRDSDGDAGIYWIGRMLAGGEDPRYIVRRLINFASEDVYDPQAMILANAVYDICEKMGMPECELPIMNLAYYLADLPKKNHIYRAMQAMHHDIAQHGNLPVPLHLRNAPTELMKRVGYGKWYEYAHNLPEKKSAQEHFPDTLRGRKYREE